MEIIYTDWGLANRFNDHIEMNINLKKYPKLHRKILMHELRHTDKVFSWEDLKNDLSSSGIKTWDIIKFMIQNPKSFTQIIPFYYTPKKGFVYDINLSLMWGVILLSVGGVIYLGINVL